MDAAGLKIHVPTKFEKAVVGLRARTTDAIGGCSGGRLAEGQWKHREEANVKTDAKMATVLIAKLKARLGC